jgi:three-Cys-motif partner protein
VATGFFDQPFDEGTLVKLDLFEAYAGAWLPVFLSAPPRRSQVHLFDFFAGQGTDSAGQLGSPLRLLKQLAVAEQRYPGWPLTRVHAHFFDLPSRVPKLRETIGRQPPIPGLHLEVEPLEFSAAFEKCRPLLASPSAAKLVLIDQFGVGHVTDDIFRMLSSAPTCDFLFFISSSTLNRFHEHPAITQKIVRPDDHYHVHRAALEYYRGLLAPRSKYFLAPFSIKKGANIYGLIFGTSHPLGMDKFLEVAWQRDPSNGEANFDVHRDNIQPNQQRFDLPEFRPTKLTAFERELENQIRSRGITNESEIIELCFRHGVRRQHAADVLGRLKNSGVIAMSWRTPQIDHFDKPRTWERVATLFE